MTARTTVIPFGRRSFLFHLAAFGLTPKARTSERSPEPIYWFQTPECDVRMSVQFFGNAFADSLRFRDTLTRHAFCLSADGDTDSSCLQRFNGSIAVAHYHFRSRLLAASPFRLREIVRTIDQDSRMTPRRPFERTLPVEREMVSDIQAFGYDPADPQRAASGKSGSLWALLRQDLFLDDQRTAFLTVHWKHTFSLISLVDVIPGDTTQQISK
jgi:hypothetical protein